MLSSYWCTQYWYIISRIIQQHQQHRAVDTHDHDTINAYSLTPKRLRDAYVLALCRSPAYDVIRVGIALRHQVSKSLIRT